MLVFLSEVAEQHPASAHILRNDIFFHRLDASFIPSFTLFVDSRGDVHKTKFLPFARIYNIRSLFVRNIIHDATFGKRDQYVINLFTGQSGTYGQGGFADIGIIGKHSGVRTENHLYQSFRFRSHFPQFVQFVPANRKKDAWGVVLFVRIFQITGLSQYLQRTVYRNREVFELPAKLFQVKFTYTLETVAHCHLIVILQMLVHIEDIFFIGKSIHYTPV